MYKKTTIAMVGYIRNCINNLAVHDATIPFKEEHDYSAIYVLNLTPTSPHENFIGSNQIDENLKAFNYKKTRYINVRVDFRGLNCYTNMATFENSFLQEDYRDFLKEAGFGFLGLSAVSPITSLRDVKVKQGLTITVKLISDDLVIEQSPIIKHIDIKVSNKL